jgi:hypothetical protein
MEDFDRIGSAGGSGSGARSLLPRTATSTDASTVPTRQQQAQARLALNVDTRTQWQNHRGEGTREPGSTPQAMCVSRIASARHERGELRTSALSTRPT